MRKLIYTVIVFFVSKTAYPQDDIFSIAMKGSVEEVIRTIKENADVVSMFVGKRLDYEHINQLADLAKGEAKVIKWEDKAIAVYKDDNGKIQALDPVCPHAGCVVAWNGAEKSWDCPCHGGRYACDGKLLTGPATRGLSVLDWSHL